MNWGWQETARIKNSKLLTPHKTREAFLRFCTAATGSRVRLYQRKPWGKRNKPLCSQITIYTEKIPSKGAKTTSLPLGGRQ